MAKKAAFYTVGCKLNIYETESLKSIFDKNGYQIVAPDEGADVYVINTCTVTSYGDSDCRKLIRRAVRNKKDGKVVVTGCYAQRNPLEIAEIPGVDLVLGNREKGRLVEYVNSVESGNGSNIFVSDNPQPAEFIDFHTSYKSNLTRATLKLQDGCDEHCTYCIIPRVRGRSISRPLSDIVDQTKRLVASGYREVALTGVNTGSYGLDLEEDVVLLDVLKKLDRIDGLLRIRMNSLEPGCVSDDLIDFAADSEKICRHFHVPLQSGDDIVLRRMGRSYRTGYYAETIGKIADKIKGCAIGADVMVGFPGEDEDGFLNSYRFIEEIPLTYLHVFSYSQREGTPAVRMKGHVSPEIKAERSKSMRQLSRKKRIDFQNSFLGKGLEVLVEDNRDSKTGLLTGLSDNYIRVRLDVDEDRVNEIVAADMVWTEGEAVLGEVKEAGV